MHQFHYFAAAAPTQWAVTTGGCSSDVEARCTQYGSEYVCQGCQSTTQNQILALQNLLLSLVQNFNLQSQFTTASTKLVPDKIIGFRTCRAIGILSQVSSSKVAIPADLQAVMVACQTQHDLDATLRAVARWVPSLYTYFSQVAAVIGAPQPSGPVQPTTPAQEPLPTPTPGLPKPSLAKAALPLVAAGMLLASTIGMIILGSRQQKRSK